MTVRPLILPGDEVKVTPPEDVILEPWVGTVRAVKPSPPGWYVEVERPVPGSRWAYVWAVPSSMVELVAVRA